MNDLENPIEDELEAERALFEHARAVLEEAFDETLGFPAPEDEQYALMQRVTSVIKSCSDLTTLIMESSVLCMEEGLALDIPEALRRVGIIESKPEAEVGGLVSSQAAASDEAHEELARERTERRAILLKYQPFVTERFIEERLTIQFLAEGSVEWLIYQGVVWELAEPHINRIGEKEALHRSKALLKSHGIKEPTE